MSSWAFLWPSALLFLNSQAKESQNEVMLATLGMAFPNSCVLDFITPEPFQHIEFFPVLCLERKWAHIDKPP